MLNLDFLYGNKSAAPKQDNFKVGQVIRNTENNNVIIITGQISAEETGRDTGMYLFVEQDGGSEYDPKPERAANAEEKRVDIKDWKEFLQKTGYMN